MTFDIRAVPDPEFDLVLERVVDVPPEAVWRAWTDPERLKKWFCPLPWKTTLCEIDLKPGGKFATTMEGPEGQNFSSAGCYLEIVPNERLVWTGALGPGFRPRGAASEEFLFTAVIEMQRRGAGTRYVATAIHPDVGTRAKHAAMGFHEGWGKALDQLVAMVKGEV